MQQEQKRKLPRERDLARAEHVTEEVCRHLLFAALGALCGGAELFFGVRPFGVALTAAASVYLPSAALGAAIFAAFAHDTLTLAALGITVFARLVLTLCFERREGRIPYFRERPLFRVTAAAVAVFAVGVTRAVGGGYRFYDLFGLLLALAAAPLAAYLYLGLFEERDKLFPYSREVGLAALVLTAVFAMREVSFAGIYPAAVAAAGVAFLLTAHRGIFVGAVGGALAGLCFDWWLAPAFLLCGVCFGLLEKSSRGGGILAGSAAAAGWGFLLRGTEGLALLLPALLTAGALFLALDSTGLVEGAPSRRAALTAKRAAAQSAQAGAADANEAKLSALSAAFSELSGTLYELSDKTRRPGQLDLKHLCDSTFDGVCPNCRHRETCWGSEYAATAQTLSALSDHLHARGAVTAAQIPAALAARCEEMPRILTAVNSGATRLSEEALRGDKTSVVAMDYAAVGRVLSEAIDRNREDFYCDPIAGERILSRLTRLGFSLECAAVCGKEHRRVILRGVRLPGERLKLRELRQLIEPYCHFRLGEPRVATAEGLTDITFPEREAFRTDTVRETRPKSKDGRYCGDTVTALSSEDGFDRAFLCDGMGSGGVAALTSTLAASFLSKLLSAGGRADSSLRMLNGFLAARGRRENESSTTVDLLEIDRVTGEASLYKCGAAPTFLLRHGEVSRFFSRTAPVGILETLDAERIRFHVEEGDVIVQVSDGVTEGEEDCAFLAGFLRDRWDGEAQNFARMVLNHAAETNTVRDDMSVVVTVVAGT